MSAYGGREPLRRPLRKVRPFATELGASSRAGSITSGARAKAGTGAAAPSAQSVVGQAFRSVRCASAPRVATVLAHSCCSESVALKAHCSCCAASSAAAAPQPRQRRYSLIHEGIAGNPTPARVSGGLHDAPT